jgi:dTDP-4-dehydrorhamnose reductase
MRILVTGRNGQIATSLRELARSSGREVVALGRPALDLAGDPGAIERAIVDAGPEVVIAAAAYTSVDLAENDADTARAINVRGAEAVAAAAKRLGVPLLHLSTDYVFDGCKEAPYVESDPTCPTSVYGETKRDGEDAALRCYDNVAIMRTAWVYSPFGNNFVKTILRLANERDEVGVVADQIGNPTNALDLAGGLLAIAENLRNSNDASFRGTFHMAASGSASWAEFAEAIIETSRQFGGPTARVRHIATSEYPTVAKRPADSRLDCAKLEQVHGVRLPHWKKSAEAIVARLIHQPCKEKGPSGK